MDRLYWEAYIRDDEPFPTFVERAIAFQHIYMGEVREAVAHSEEISKYGRVIYNENAWDLEKFSDMKDEMTVPNHYEVVKEVLLRIEKYKCPKIDVGYLGRWKNPYQLADTLLPVGVTFTFERIDNLYFFRGSFFQPHWWFSPLCKPLFKTDTLVMKEPDASWNMNPVGLISAKPEKVLGNRRAMLNMVVDFCKEFELMFMSLSYSQTYYNPNTNVAYIIDPAAKNDQTMHPLIVAFKEGGRLVFSDSSEHPFADYKTLLAKDKKIYLEKSHFDF